jgi:hypothetical protein
LTRFAARLPRWTIILATYAEVLWTFMLFTLVARWWTSVLDWFAERQAVGWLRGFGDRFAVNLEPIAAVWEGTTWLIGILVAALIVPAAWLTVAGVIFGTTFDSTPAFSRFGGGAARGAAMSIARTLVMRLEGLWAAVTVIWRGGPLLFGAYALAYALWAFAEQAGTRGVLLLIGGHERWFWAGVFPLITVAIAAVAEPLRVAIVATAYDSVIGRPRSGLDTRPSGVDAEASEVVVAPLDVEQEGTFGVLGQQERQQDAVRRRFGKA